ncbi:MAG TPA: Na+/H+ antiporter [Candidatus Limnocylindrales bacterium]|nr:Na+/H+ antiporter [Candidatus Limnocylindrales bacterium]HEU4919211.1 Na+/H+ antiporter [Candidatus Limnocylindrales bacterium]
MIAAATSEGAAGGSAAPIGAIEVVLLLLLAATALAILARRIGIPYPILLMLGGLALGFVPSLPPMELEPDLVFLLFLPPILFGAGYFTSIRDFRANLRPIALLSVGLVLATTVAVAAVAQALIPGLGWAAAFALGAIVAPPDAVAATAIFQRLGVPRRAVTILEGESLVNDATALVAYRFAVAAALSGTFSIVDAGTSFVLVAVGGVAFGLVVGVVVAAIFRRLDDPVFEIVISFLAPAAAYVPAEHLGVSGVLAAVAAGIYTGRHASRTLSSSGRVGGAAAWQVLLFLINGSVFILMGVQLPSILAGIADRPVGELVGLAVAVSLTAILVRILWVFPGTYVPRRLSAGIREREAPPPPRNVFLVAWAGMRGVVSLAAALALPLDFPERDLLIFLTFGVILATLVGQGLTLPLVIRGLGIVGDDGDEQEEAQARQVAAEAAVRRIDELAAEWPGHLELIETLRGQYGHRARDLEIHHAEGPTDESEQELLEHRAIRRGVIDAEREALDGLREAGAIRDEIYRRLERDLDLDELRMEA